MIKLYKLLKPFTMSVMAVLMLVFLQTLSELYLPTLMSDLVDIGIVNGDTDYIIQIGLFMLLIALAGTVCSVIASFLSAKVAVGFGSNLREKVFSQIESFSLHEFDKLGTATLITRTTNDITQVQMVTVMILRMMLMAPLMCIGGIIMALSEDRPLTIILLVVMPILAAAIGIIAKKGIPLFKLMQVKLDKLNLVLRENLTGIRVIRAFDRSDYEKRRFEEANADLTSNAIKVNIIMAALMPIMLLIMNLTTVAIIWFGGIRIDSGGMQVGSLMAFIQYAMQIMFSLLMVSLMFVMIPRAAASAVRINEVLDTFPEIIDPLPAQQADEPRGLVEFKDASFSYPGAEQPAVSHISFTARPGEVNAIIGGTGSGKSTLINLIPRFYDVNEGSILIDGIDVRDYTQADLRSKIGLVPQKTLLFAGSVSENISYGKPGATQEEIHAAAAIAQASEFVAAMQGGFDSAVAQGGTTLSGGQKQRISIARALIRRAQIYIFDDSFSALDFKTDARLRTALKKVISSSTVFIIAQRVTTVMDADQIIVLDDGKMVGRGKHKELLESCAVYREIVYSQLSEEELA
ncbi:MAG: ABC transporter ATP-binding protein [Syntrophomonadaceae bacterium]|nr:ABC transporter ATP-binding protein [Syntrophomonadaceae bacterium]MDD3023855.1 ABC transporter ATP-binding protein [Syntrophomonadaceae bacterium]